MLLRYLYCISPRLTSSILVALICFLEFVHCSILKYGFILTMESFYYLVKKLVRRKLYSDFNAPAGLIKQCGRDYLFHFDTLIS